MISFWLGEGTEAARRFCNVCACKDGVNSSSTFTGHQGTARAPTQYIPFPSLTEMSHLTEPADCSEVKKEKKQHYE